MRVLFPDDAGGGSHLCPGPHGSPQSDRVANVDVYPPEKGFGAPASNMAAEHIWDVVAILEDDYDWNEAEIRGYLGENLMRVYAANWE